MIDCADGAPTPQTPPILSREMVYHLPMRWVWLIAFFLCSALPGALAQTVSSKPESAPAAAASPAAPAAAANNVIPLKNSNGETVPLLGTPLVEQLLEQLKAYRQQQQEPTAWSIARISLEGTADGDQATLQVILQIQLLVNHRWILVPLKLTEGTLQDQSHNGPGESVSSGFDPDDGYLWWLKGKGLHELKFNLIVPLRKELPSRRLQLTLPPTVVSELKLRVPVPRLTAKGDEAARSRLTWKPTTDGATQIDMIGLGSRLDLTWQPQLDLGTVETVLESRTAITATIDGRTILLEANQRLGALQGNFSRVQVRLPRGGELLKVDGDLFKERLVDEKDPSLVTVVLKDSVGANVPVDLKWAVRVDIPAPSDRILIEGFEVTKARIQTGHLAIRLVGDYRLERVGDQNPFVQRDNLSTLEKASPSFPIRDDVSSAYSILRQPFQLAFSLQPEKPHVTVTPRLFLSLSAERMELYGEYDVQVYRGGIEDVNFNWPGWKTEGWKIDPVSPPNQVEETRFEDANEIRAKLIERKVSSEAGSSDRTSVTAPKQFTLLLHATRAFSADQPSQDFTLPGVSDANLSTADFVLVLADNLDADLRPLGETATRLQSVTASTTVLPPKNLVDLRRRYYRLDAAHAKLSVATTVQKQKIGTQTDIDFSLDGSELQFTQRITYDVAYDRLSQALLWVPDQLLGHATFSVSDESDPEKFSPLVPIATGNEDGVRKQQRLELVPPRINKFQILVQATLPVTWPTGSITADLDEPFVLSADGEYSATRVRVQKPKRQRLSLDSDGWTPQSPQSGASVWLAAAKKTRAILQCEKSDGSGQQGIAVPRRLVQAMYALNGEVICHAKFYLTGSPSVVRARMPSATQPLGVKWGNNKLDRASYSSLPDTTGNYYQMTLPDMESDDDEPVLTIVYQLPRQSRMETGDQRRLSAAEVVSDGSPTQTFWEIQLPENQHLWTLPPGFTPEFDWQRTGGWWMRVPRHSEAELNQWVSGASELTATTALAMRTNRYLFSSMEGAGEMTFFTLSAPLIVLIGSSLALLLGFILVNVPSTQHVLTFLTLGFLTTVAALWYSEPVLVLLQPAGLGLLLAMLASVAQRRFRRARVSSAITLAAPSDILTATSSREEVIPHLVTAGEPTQDQPPVFPVPEAGINL